MALDLLLTCLVLQISLLVLTERNFVSACMFMNAMGTSASYGVGGSSPMQLQPSTTLYHAAEGVRGRSITLLPLAPHVTGGRTTR